MGNCKYCGNPAGFLRSRHPDCEATFLRKERLREGGRQRIGNEALRALTGSVSFQELEKTIAGIEKSYDAEIGDRKTMLAQAWERAVEKFLEDGVLDANEEKRLAEFKDCFGLTQDDLDKNGAITKVAKAGVLREVLEGVIPTRAKFDGGLPVNLQKGELAIWAFPGSSYFETKTRRHYVGGSHGASIRVMKGVYYRVSAFKGHPVETEESVHVDNGLVIITNKNIYFAGPQKSMRIPYGKIVSFQPFSDGVGIMRDASTAKPQFFRTGDGWFIYNLVTNVSQISASAS